jgi:hypothetical protein
MASDGLRFESFAGSVSGKLELGVSVTLLDQKRHDRLGAALECCRDRGWQGKRTETVPGGLLAAEGKIMALTFSRSDVSYPKVNRLSSTNQLSATSS